MMSSWTSVKLWMISMAEPTSSKPLWVSPIALATSHGRTRACACRLLDEVHHGLTQARMTEAVRRDAMRDSMRGSTSSTEVRRSAPTARGACG